MLMRAVSHAREWSACRLDVLSSCHLRPPSQALSTVITYCLGEAFPACLVAVSHTPLRMRGTFLVLSFALACSLICVREAIPHEQNQTYKEVAADRMACLSWLGLCLWSSGGPYICFATYITSYNRTVYGI